jgi:hypothetical protein
MSLVTDTADLTSRLNLAMSDAIASSSTPDISSANGNSIRITGTTTITGFGTASKAGITRTLIFNDAVLLTNGGNLVLFGGANITTVADDVAVFLAETTTLWRMIGFHRPSAITGGKINTNGVASGAITSAKIGDASVINSKLPIKVVAALTDADQTLEAGQIITSGILTCTPSVARVKTLPLAVDIIALLTGYQIGTKFEFTLLSLAAFDVTIATNTGITLVGGLVVNNSSATFIGVVNSSTTLTIYRK